MRRSFLLLIAFTHACIALAYAAPVADTPKAPTTYVDGGLAGQIPLRSNVTAPLGKDSTADPKKEHDGPKPSSNSTAPAGHEDHKDGEHENDHSADSAGLKNNVTIPVTSLPQNATQRADLTNATVVSPSDQANATLVNTTALNVGGAPHMGQNSTADGGPNNATATALPFKSDHNATHAAIENPPVPTNKTLATPLSPVNSTSTLADSDKEKTGATTDNAASSLFPTYHEFRGSDSPEQVAPFLAQTDTLFSSDSQRAYGPAPYEVRYHPAGDDNGRFDVPKHWGVLSPYFSSPLHGDLSAMRPVPQGCTIQQVHLLHRHGARMPKHDPHEAPPQFEAWFGNVTADDPQRNGGRKATFSGPLSFLSTWSYTLGSDHLAPAGIQEMFDSGIYAHYRYAPLFDSATTDGKPHKPVLRTTSQRRMIDSARYWAMGFAGANASALLDTEVQIEASGFNTTLAAYESCPGAKLDLEGSHQKAKWIDHYLQRATERLQRHVHGATLTPAVVFGMQSLCPYETFALGLSHFCNLFSQEEWIGFQYAHDLVFMGNFGFGAKTGRAQGIGWVQDLVRRLKGPHGQAAISNTSQNATWMHDDKVFPVDQRFFADFTHGRELVSVLTALNFHQLATPLDPLKPDPMRNFQTSHVAPSAARLVAEVLQCDERHDPSSGDAHRRYIRFLLNDALLPMDNQQGCLGHDAHRDGLCPLDAFIHHVETVATPAAQYQQVCFDNDEVRAAAASAKAGNTTDGAGDDNATAVSQANSTANAPKPRPSVVTSMPLHDRR